MAYQANKPLATDQLSQSQTDLLGNFTAIGTMMDPNNNLLTLPVAAGDPATVAAGKGDLYTKTLGSSVGLYWKPDTATAPILIGPGGGGSASSWVLLNNGMYMEWGADVTDSVGLLTITLAKITNCVSAQVSPIGGFRVSVSSPAPNAIRIATDYPWDPGHTLAPNGNFYWLAIGS